MNSSLLHSQPKSTVGTPAYIAPEVLSRKEYDGKDWNFNKTTTIGNWIRCRELVYKDGDDDEGTVCGKWRRAPLSEVQTDDWDCSCAVLWDPFHADCIVPQELETDIVLEHLKYVEKWRFLLANKKTDQTRSNVLHKPED